MRRTIVFTVLLGFAGRVAAEQGFQSTPRALSDYGYVQDVNLGNSAGDLPADGDFCQTNNQSCVPTSWTNSLVYLQNQYGIDLAGLEIAGSDYTAWTATIETLRSADYMNTSPEDPGTTPYGQVHGIQTFLMHQGAGPLATSYQAIAANFMLEQYEPEIPPGEAYPAWLMRGAPVLSQLHYWLEADAAVVIDVLWGTNGIPNGNGHALALVGVEWTDSNNNSRIDEGEAFLDVVDPLDPTHGNYSDNGFQPVGPARITQMTVWQDPQTEPPATPTTFGLLNISYMQYKANCGQPFPFAEDFPNGDPAYGFVTGWLGGAGALNIIGGPGGSCCLVTGCDALTEVQCADLGGSWTLSGSCDDCAEYCEGDSNNDGYIDMDDLLNMLGNWGACP